MVCHGSSCCIMECCGLWKSCKSSLPKMFIEGWFTRRSAHVEIAIRHLPLQALCAASRTFEMMCHTEACAMQRLHSHCYISKAAVLPGCTFCMCTECCQRWHVGIVMFELLLSLVILNDGTFFVSSTCFMRVSYQRPVGGKTVLSPRGGHWWPMRGRE